MTRVETHKIHHTSSDEAYGGKEVSGQLVVTGCDSSEVLKPAEGVLDAMPLFVGFLVEAERLFAVRPVGDDGLGAAIDDPGEMPVLLEVAQPARATVAMTNNGRTRTPERRIGMRTGSTLRGSQNGHLPGSGGRAHERHVGVLPTHVGDVNR